MRNPMLIKPKMKIYVALLVAVVAMMIALGRCSKRHAAQQDGKSGGDTLDVAIEYSPLSLYMYGDTLGGFNHDLLMLISEKERIAIKLHPMTSLSESLRKLDEGIYDIVAAEVPATSDFKTRYLFSSPIFIDSQVLVQRKDTAGNVAVRTQLDLARRTICVTRQSPVVTRIANLAREIGDSIYAKESDYSQEQLFLLVASGEEEFAVVNALTAHSLSADYPNVDISTAVSFNQFHSWVLKRGDTALLRKLDKWLADIKDSDSYRRLQERYLTK